MTTGNVELSSWEMGLCNELCLDVPVLMASQLLLICTKESKSKEGSAELVFCNADGLQVPLLDQILICFKSLGH